MKDGSGQSLLIDTNVLLRFLTGDDPSKAEACKELFERAERNEVELHINELVLAELVWTLRSSYGRAREQIVEALEAIMSLAGLHVHRKAVLEEAIDLYERFNVDFVDAYNAADLRARGLDAVCSYDAHFDRLGVRRLAPGEH
ncbi:MAG: type II toxin-antitoxin system VapC family toxin [Dehalococcoidia bacterium]|nr:type II toxin-antitoxin system VapC family toxin [Dehalococcoidia bacterium]